jgi:hypothetical protein
MDVRQRIVDEFLSKLAEFQTIEESLQEGLARLVNGESLTQEKLLDLFRAAADHES